MKEFRQKILVVDDSPINVQILNEALKEHYRVFFATNGRDAIRIAATSVPDIILLDIMMPEMDGYEVCRTIKADPVTMHIPIIFITAMSQHESEAAGLELGASDYITKPFHPELVKLRIRNQLELKRQRDMLSKLSMLDGLTGIPNRRSFDEYFSREWRRAQRNQSEISIIMCDIDHFKSYNDSYGHLAGDDCLRRVAMLLETTLDRPADFVARYGGEEFVFVLPETGMPGTYVIAEKLRSAVEAEKITHQFSMVAPYITVSLGVSSCTPSAGMEPLELLSRADKLLYLAKREGRNRVAGEGSSY